MNSSLFEPDPGPSPAPDPTDAELVDSLGSTVCPTCDRRKIRAQTLCVGCYRRLPRDAQVNLYRRLGHGYREAVLRALRLLGAAAFRLPGGDA